MHFFRVWNKVMIQEKKDKEELREFENKMYMLNEHEQKNENDNEQDTVTAIENTDSIPNVNDFDDLIQKENVNRNGIATTRRLKSCKKLKIE